MLDIVPGRPSPFLYQYPDKLQMIINRLKKRFGHLDALERRQRIIAEIQKMNLTDLERQEIFRRLRYKRPVRSV
jgi:hypothetical protein